MRGKYIAYGDSVRAAFKKKHNDLLKTDAQYYLMNSGKLGWINCDRFYATNSDKGTICIKTEGQSDWNIKAIFKGMKSLMQLNNNLNGSYTADNIPMGLAVRYIVVENRPDGLYYAVKDDITSKNALTGFDFKPMTVEAIKKELDSI